MRSSRAHRMTNDLLHRAGQRATGQRPSPMVLAAGQAMANNVSDMSALPVIPSDTQLQDSSGHPTFVMNWSMIGGTDKMV